MNPAEPETRTFSDMWFAFWDRGSCCSVPWCRRPGAVGCSVLPSPGAQLFDGQRRPEGEAVPPQILRQPFAQLEVGVALFAVQPDGRDLGDRAAQAAGLGGELDADLEAVPGVDADLPDEGRGVGLE